VGEAQPTGAAEYPEPFLVAPQPRGEEGEARGSSDILSPPNRERDSAMHLGVASRPRRQQDYPVPGESVAFEMDAAWIG